MLSRWSSRPPKAAGETASHNGKFKRLLIICSFLSPSLSSQLWLLLTIGLFVVTFRSADGATTFNFRKCHPVKRDLLRQRLGTAYNHRYMAMDHADLHSKINQSPSQNRDHVTTRNITKRSSSIRVDHITDPAPWTCQTSDIWLDLGQGFFPRLVRSVECSSNKCWFGHFQCRPKHYTIKVLKKKEDECIRVNSATGIPRYQDFWKEVSYQITVDCQCSHWC